MIGTIFVPLLVLEWPDTMVKFSMKNELYWCSCGRAGVVRIDMAILVRIAVHSQARHPGSRRIRQESSIANGLATMW